MYIHSLFIFGFLYFMLSTTISANQNPPRESGLERFLRYVQIDTQSKPGTDTIPTTRGQLDLANLLAAELYELGIKDVKVTENGFVYAHIPGNLSNNNRIPVIGFIAHLDTSPMVSGKNVKPIIHKNYQGQDLILPKDTLMVLSPADNPELLNLIGDDIITADGTTLLGSDDKAGIAEIMTLVDILQQNLDIPHCEIALAFTPDEEGAGGILKFDHTLFGAKFAYTIDGYQLGEINNETFNAREATVKFFGNSTHAGKAEGKMINATFALADFISRIPINKRPETTSGRQGFFFPYMGQIGVAESTLNIKLRSFVLQDLDKQVEWLLRNAKFTEETIPGIKVALDVQEAYGNIESGLKENPKLIEFAKEATRRTGIEPFIKPLRGGTDGSFLTLHGLPCPNLFTGGNNFHSKLEYNSRGGLEKTTEMLLHLIQLFTETIE